MASTVTELLRRRFAGKKSILPQGYTQLNYIENTAGSMFVIEQSVGFRVLFEYTPNLSATFINYACMFGQNSNFQAAYRADGKAYIGNAGSTDVFFTNNTKATIECNITRIANTSSYYVDNVNTGLQRGSTASSWLFFSALETGGFTARGKLHSFKMWNSNDELIMNLIPCKDSNNVCGMYDIINDTFYSSITSDPFTGG